jgi:S-DNA-T family DNA segregation ATPase FtsK/SpoIIIE
MSSTTYQRRRERLSATSSERKKFDEGLPVANKKQILGFFLILFSLLVTLSIVSYSDIDQSKIESFSLRQLLTKESQTAAFDTSNWLGMTGVYISSFLIRNAFGYFSILIPFLLLAAGFLMIRKRHLTDMLQFSVYMLLLMILFSSLSGKLRLSMGDKIPFTLSGRTGDYFSSVLNTMLGSVGTYLLLSGLILVFGFLVADRDIVKSFARTKLFFVALRNKYRDSIAEIEEKKKIKRLSRGAGFREAQKDSEIEPEAAGSGHEIKDTKINRHKEELIIPEEEPWQQKKQIPLFNEEIESSENRTETFGNVPMSPDENGDIITEKLEDFKQPSLDLLDEPLKEELELISDEELKENGRLLQAKLLHFDVKIEKVIATPGPVVTLYELIPADDVKLSRIESLQDDIALAMKARGIRMIIPIPGKGTVGVEIPNQNPCIVKIKSLLASRTFNDTNFQLPITLGKTISGDVYVDDLASMPHLLVAGATGSGKSVGINTIITSLLYKLHPSDLKFILIDPKKIELSLYSKLKNHYLATSSDVDESIVTTPQNAINILKSLEIEMEKRYERLANATVRNIADYNKKISLGLMKDDGEVKHGKMPYLIVIIDELADLMITAAREVEEPIARLAQLARAVGIHLVLATQRPSVDVITGVIKANFSARIAYLVNSKVDSRTILDMNGAEQLIGQGDMLYLPPRKAKPMRMQSPFISTDEVERIMDFISTQKGFSRPYELPSAVAHRKKAFGDAGERDELFEEAAKLFIRHQKGSVSLLQRRLKVGYARAARIVDELEIAGIVGPGEGSKEREVLIESEQQLEEALQT